MFQSRVRGNTRVRIGNAGWYAKFNLGARIFFTPQIELTAQPLAPFAHSGQPPVARPLTLREDLRIHTYSIIAHTDGEIGFAKGEIGLNVPGLRMLIGVADRLARDAIGLVTNEGG